MSSGTYCEKFVDDMLKVGNQALCGGTARDVGFYFAVNFPVFNDGDTYAFRTPTDFGRGGVSILDGEEMVRETSDIWEGGNSAKLDFSATLNRG